MSMPQNFRSAINGFRREDVVHYLEYLNAKHSTEVTQLTQEADSLRAKIADLEQQLAQQPVAADHTEELLSMKAKLDAALAEKQELEEKLNSLPTAAPVVSTTQTEDVQRILSEKNALQERYQKLEAAAAQKDALQKRCQELELVIRDQDTLQKRCDAMELAARDRDVLQLRCNELEQAAAERDALQKRCRELELASQDREDLKTRCEEMTQSVQDREELASRCARLESELSALQAGRKQELAQQELDAYRRAEQAERIATEKANAIYNRSNAMLQDATGRIEGASTDLTDLADQINVQLQQMQYAINAGKVALRSAVESLNSMHVETK